MSAAANDPCTCPGCLARQNDKRCPDCSAIIPAAWDYCWPCQLERTRDAEVLQRFWTP